MASEHGVDVCACGAVITQCRCWDHSERRVVQQSCPACRPGATEPTILGCPVVAGRAETPLGVVEIEDRPEEPENGVPGMAFWSVDLGHGATMCSDALDDEAECIADADRVLSALYAVGRVAGLREAVRHVLRFSGDCCEHLAGDLEQRADAVERGAGFQIVEADAIATLTRERDEARADRDRLEVDRGEALDARERWHDTAMQVLEALGNLVGEDGAWGYTAARAHTEASKWIETLAEQRTALCVVLGCEPVELLSRVTELRREHDRRVGYNERLRVRAIAAVEVLQGKHDKEVGGG